MFAPYIVTTAAPVPAALQVDVELAAAASTDTLSETVPSIPPTLTATRLVPDPPRPCLQLTTLSDCQIVCSHCVCPITLKALNAAKPIRAPRTVKDAEPLAAWLAS